MKLFLANDETAFDDLSKSAIKATGAVLTDAEAFFASSTASPASFASVAGSFELAEAGDSLDLQTIGLVNDGSDNLITIDQAKALLLAGNKPSPSILSIFDQAGEIQSAIEESFLSTLGNVLLRNASIQRLGILSTQVM